jgi:thioesterase domain-containing protein
MYEVAQILTGMGETVAALVLLDPPDLYFFILRRRIHNIGKLVGIPAGKCRNIYQRIAEGIEIWHYNGFLQLVSDFWKRTIVWSLKRLKPIFKFQGDEPVSNQPNLNFHYYEVMAAYEPKTYQGSEAAWIILRRGEGDRSSRQVSYWSGFIPNVHFEVIPGTHLELQNTIGEIATIIKRALANYEPGHPAQPEPAARAGCSVAS